MAVYFGNARPLEIMGLQHVPQGWTKVTPIFAAPGRGRNARSWPMALSVVVLFYRTIGSYRDNNGHKPARGPGRVRRL